MTLLIVIFGEAIPKAYGIHNDQFAFRVAKPLYAIRGVFYPFIKVFSVISDSFLQLVGKEQRGRMIITEEEVKTKVPMIS
ncbi:MAG: DUF21 domain-containing protein [Methanophagales archaeon]|nr:DUF21 domain-containing protein [Methanophagales archaeon]